MDFSSLGYIPEESQMLSDMHKAITAAEAWEWLRTFNGESFMFCGDPEIDRIAQKLAGANNHSGFSFAWTMRQLEGLAKMGPDAFSAEVIKNKGGKVRKTDKREYDAAVAEVFALRRKEAGKHINCTCTVESDRLADLAMSARRRELEVPCSQAYLDMRRAEREAQGLFLWCNCPKVECADERVSAVTEV
jgi:hypothetical protein